MPRPELYKLLDADIRELKKTYEQHVYTAPHIAGLLSTYFKWKLLKPQNEYMAFYSLDNKWKTTGTFVMKFSIFDLVLFTLEDNGNALYTILKETHILQQNRNTGRFAFYNPYNSHMPVIYKALSELNIPIKLRLDVGYYWIVKEKALTFDTKCPDNVYVGDVDRTYIPLILSLWPHMFEGAHEYLSIFIEMNGACGLYLKENKQLICWILRNHWGMLTVLETLPEYKRLGYASLMTKVMSKKIAEEGNNPLCTIVNGNEASQRMFTKLGFERLTDATYIEI